MVFRGLTFIGDFDSYIDKILISHLSAIYLSLEMHGYKTLVNFILKIVLIHTLMLVSIGGYSQSESDIDNLSHPFQVVYAENASYIARQEKIKSFDYTNRYGLIRNKGKLILLHYSGYLFEADEGLIDIREIAESLESENSYVRPPISPEANISNQDPWKTEKQYHKIQLLYPWKHTIQLSRHERLPIQWYYDGESTLPRKYIYNITIKDLHDRVLLHEETKEDYFEVILDSLNLPENLIICTISLPIINEVSDDIVVAFEQEHQMQSPLPRHYSTTKYQSFIDGLIAIQKNEFELASKLFHIAIDTHEDPIFDSMYRQLLNQYPQLKAALK